MPFPRGKGGPGIHGPIRNLRPLAAFLTAAASIGWLSEDLPPQPIRKAPIADDVAPTVRRSVGWASDDLPRRVRTTQPIDDGESPHFIPLRSFVSVDEPPARFVRRPIIDDGTSPHFAPIRSFVGPDDLIPRVQKPPILDDQRGVHLPTPAPRLGKFLYADESRPRWVLAPLRPDDELSAPMRSAGWFTDEWRSRSVRQPLPDEPWWLRPLAAFRFIDEPTVGPWRRPRSIFDDGLSTTPARSFGWQSDDTARRWVSMAILDDAGPMRPTTFTPKGLIAPDDLRAWHPAKPPADDVVAISTTRSIGWIADDAKANFIRRVPPDDSWALHQILLPIVGPDERLGVWRAPRVISDDVLGAATKSIGWIVDDLRSIRQKTRAPDDSWGLHFAPFPIGGFGEDSAKLWRGVKSPPDDAVSEAAARSIGWIADDLRKQRQNVSPTEPFVLPQASARSIGWVADDLRPQLRLQPLADQPWWLHQTLLPIVAPDELRPQWRGAKQPPDAAVFTIVRSILPDASDLRIRVGKAPPIDDTLAPTAAKSPPLFDDRLQSRQLAKRPPDDAGPAKQTELPSIAGLFSDEWRQRTAPRVAPLELPLPRAAISIGWVTEDTPRPPRRAPHTEEQLQVAITLQGDPPFLTIEYFRPHQTKHILPDPWGLHQDLLPISALFDEPQITTRRPKPPPDDAVLPRTPFPIGELIDAPPPTWRDPKILPDDAPPERPLVLGWIGYEDQHRRPIANQPPPQDPPLVLFFQPPTTIGWVGDDPQPVAARHHFIDEALLRDPATSFGWAVDDLRPTQTRHPAIDDAPPPAIPPPPIPPRPQQGRPPPTRFFEGAERSGGYGVWEPKRKREEPWNVLDAALKEKRLRELFEGKPKAPIALWKPTAEEPKDDEAPLAKPTVVIVEVPVEKIVEVPVYITAPERQGIAAPPPPPSISPFTVFAFLGAIVATAWITYTLATTPKPRPRKKRRRRRKRT